MNTPVEVDIYGHANSTHVLASRMINGIGGSGDFLRNAYISMVHFPSARSTPTDPTGVCTGQSMNHDVVCVADLEHDQYLSVPLFRCMGW